MKKIKIYKAFLEKLNQTLVKYFIENRVKVHSDIKWYLAKTPNIDSSTSCVSKFAPRRDPTIDKLLVESFGVFHAV